MSSWILRPWYQSNPRPFALITEMKPSASKTGRFKASDTTAEYQAMHQADWVFAWVEPDSYVMVKNRVGPFVDGRFTFEDIRGYLEKAWADYENSDENKAWLAKAQYDSFRGFGH